MEGTARPGCTARLDSTPHPILPMKIRPLLLRTAPILPALFAVSTARATVTAFLPPRAVTWVTNTDTGTVAMDGSAVPAPIVPGVTFAGFDPPIITQFQQSLAFKGRLKIMSGVGVGDDEGVWSTSPQLRIASVTHKPTLVLREGNPVPLSSALFGFAGTLNVENLQSPSGDWTVCATNTTLGKVAVANNTSLHNIGESPTAAWSDLAPPVTTNFFTTQGMAMWKRETASPLKSGVERRGAPAFTAWDTNFTSALGPFLTNQPIRDASPVISEKGWVASYARDLLIPANHIRHTDPTCGSTNIIVRQGTPALTPVPGFVPASARFGVIHNKLMASSDAPTLGYELVAWQMQTMLIPATVNKTSLWCKTGTYYHCLAWQSQNAPDLPAGNTIQSFYALHAVPDFSNPDEHWVFWGAMISPSNRVAIYRTHIAKGVASMPDLIASSVPSSTPVMLISGGVQGITAIDRYFSVNVHGAVLFKATCAGAPPGQRQILVTAQLVGGSAREVRAQSGIGTAGVTPSTGTTPAVNFQLAVPEQGPCSRGQAVGTQWFTAKILYAGGQGIFWTNL